MPISEFKKQSDLEKRLKILHKQVYGKKFSAAETQSHQNTDTQNSDISYLYQDLTKIFIFASIALAIMISLKFINF